jgi:hypothetical protein
LCDELVSTRDELIYLLSEAKKVVKKYSPMISTQADPDDIEYWREYDNFLDTLDNLSYDLGLDGVQFKLHEVGSLGPNPLDKFPTIRGSK